MKPRHLLLATVAAAALLAAPHFLKSYGIYLLSYWLVYIIATMGLNLTVGYAGQKSLGHAAFVAMGAYAHAWFLGKGLPLPLSLLCAAFLCAGAGWLLGLPAIRVSGLYLAMVTLAWIMVSPAICT